MCIVPDSFSAGLFAFVLSNSLYILNTILLSKSDLCILSKILFLFFSFLLSLSLSFFLRMSLKTSIYLFFSSLSFNVSKKALPILRS